MRGLLTGIGSLPRRLTQRIVSSISLRLKLRKNQKLAAAMVSDREPLNIEVGSGDKPGTQGWVTIDMLPECDIFWDLRLGIPFPDESVDSIYSSHFLEHLSYGEIQGFLQECLRVMKPGGKFLIAVPNARIYLEAYIRGEPLEGKGYFGHWPAYNNTTRIDYVNYMAYMDGHHKYMFDQENLLFILQAAGFRDVSERSFDALIDAQWRDFESIYAAATK